MSNAKSVQIGIQKSYLVSNWKTSTCFAHVYKNDSIFSDYILTVTHIQYIQNDEIKPNFNLSETFHMPWFSLIFVSVLLNSYESCFTLLPSVPFTPFLRLIHSLSSYSSNYVYIGISPSLLLLLSPLLKTPFFSLFPLPSFLNLLSTPLIVFHSETLNLLSNFFVDATQN